MTPVQLYALQHPKLRAQELDVDHFVRVGPWALALSLNA